MAISTNLIISIFVTIAMLNQANCKDEIFETKVLKKFLHDLVKSTFDSPSSSSKVALIGEANAGCSDSATWCKTYEKYCYTDTLKTYCKQTCNTCPTPTTAAPSINCEDTHSQCHIAFQRGFCKSDSANHVSFVQKYCPKTCNFCSDKPNCVAVDKNPNCHQLERHCSSTHYKEYMEANCAKTCGICKTDEVKCGIAKRRLAKETRVIDGVEANKGFYPWQVAIYYDNDFLCGGSLISNRHVLTAAHCFRYLSTDSQRYKVVLGDHDRSNDEGTEKTIHVKNIVQHEEYNYESDAHDVALVKLTEDVTFTDFINRICLASSSDYLKTGTKCYLTGWGKTRFDGASVNRLMEVAMPIADLRHCRKRNTFNHHVVTDRMVCAGYDDGKNFKSGCHGDSGGPLACEQPDKSWLLHGVVSWGSPQCNGLERYTVFSKVSKYLDWIEKKQKE